MSMATAGKRMMQRAVARGLLPQRSVAAVATSAPLLSINTDNKNSSTMRFMSSLSGGSLLNQMATDNPYKDVVRYEHKNRKWSLQHVDYYSEALAIGLLENGLQPGDVVLSWLPAHFSESMVLQFACSKSGLILYNLDPALGEDTEAAKEGLAMALKVTKANVLITQEAGNDINYVRLCKSVIPELRTFDFATGHPFVTPRFPHLRFPVHTGYDQRDKWGMLLFKHFLVPSANLDTHLGDTVIDGSTPLLGELIVDAKGIPTGTGKVLTNDQVQESGVWSTYSSILKREFHEVEGVGVVW